MTCMAFPGHAHSSLTAILLSNSYTMGCPPVRGFSLWVILRTGGQAWYNYFIPPTSVSRDILMLMLVKVV